MHTIKYIFSKKYRTDYNKQYSSMISKTLHEEQQQLESIYGSLYNSITIMNSSLTSDIAS